MRGLFCRGRWGISIFGLFCRRLKRGYRCQRCSAVATGRVNAHATDFTCVRCHLFQSLCSGMLSQQFIPPSWNRFQRGSSEIDYSLIFSMELRSGSFWVSTYSDHQRFLVRIILRLRSENMTFAQISGWLNKRNYETPRDKEFTANHVFSIYKKRQRRDRRISVSITPVLKNFNISTLNCSPTSTTFARLWSCPQNQSHPTPSAP